MTEWKHWADERWWLTEEYARIYRERINTSDLDRVICRVADVFSRHWQSKAHAHPVNYWLLSKGLAPLEFLYGLGVNLAAIEGCLRLPSVIRDLRHSGDYESAMLELAIAAHLQRSGHHVEFRPKLPNGRSSDFVTDSKGQTVYFEIKRLRESERQLAIRDLGNLLASTLIELTNSPTRPQIRGRHYEIVVDTAVFYGFGKSRETDIKLIETVRQTIAQEIDSRLEKNLPLDFVIPSIGSVRISDAGQEGSSVMSPMPSPEAELDRIMRGHFLTGIEQLHPDHPGILIVQTPAELESKMSEAAIGDLFVNLRDQALHVSAVLILPVYNWMPQQWTLFRPFLVSNKYARIPVPNLAVFSDLRAFLDVSVKTPADWATD